MNTVDCIKSRRSIRRFKPDSVKHSLIEEIVSAASFSPSWKNTQITRYIAIKDPSLLGKIADDFTPSYNSDIIRQTPVLIAVTYIKGRCGFERDGSYTTEKKTAGRCLMPVWPVRRSVWLRTNTDWVLSLWAYLMRVEFPVFWTFQRNGNWLH